MAFEPKFDKKAWNGRRGLDGDALSRELGPIVNDRFKRAPDPTTELRSVVEDLRARGFDLHRSAVDSDEELEVWTDGALALWLHGRFGPHGELERIDRIEVLWWKM